MQLKYQQKGTGSGWTRNVHVLPFKINTVIHVVKMYMYLYKYKYIWLSYMYLKHQLKGTGCGWTANVHVLPIKINDLSCSTCT